MGTPTIKIATTRSLLAAGNGHGRGTTGTGRKVGLRPNPGPVGPATSRRPLRNYANPPDEQRGRSLALVYTYTHTYSRGCSKPLFDISRDVSRDRSYPRVPHAVSFRLRAIIERSIPLKPRLLATFVPSFDRPILPGDLFSFGEDPPNPRYLRKKESKSSVHSRVYSSVFLRE